MDHKQREEIDKAIERCRRFERQFRAIRGFLEIVNACGDITMMTDQLNALNAEMNKARATVTDINEARKATKQ